MTRCFVFVSVSGVLVPGVLVPGVEKPDILYIEDHLQVSRMRFVLFVAAPDKLQQLGKSVEKNHV